MVLFYGRDTVSRLDNSQISDITRIIHHEAIGTEMRTSLYIVCVYFCGIFYFM